MVEFASAIAVVALSVSMSMAGVAVETSIAGTMTTGSMGLGL